MPRIQPADHELFTVQPRKKRSQHRGCTSRVSHG
jgi:hypothetical protein